MGASVHILHLTHDQLRWATLEGRRSPRLVESGAIDGAPDKTLDAWIAKGERREEPIVVYDGRPMYYSFATRMPRKARKQIDSIARLRIKQEIGIPESEVSWSAHPEPSSEAPGQDDVYLTVVRRAAIEDLTRWQARHGIESLWVGPDVGAIRTLVSHGVLAAPVVILNGDRGGASLFYAEAGNPILKGRAAMNGAHGAEELPRIDWSKSASRAEFGAADFERLREAHAALKSMPASPELDVGRNGWAGKVDAQLVRELKNFDAVILGGVLDHVLGREESESLIRPAAPELAPTRGPALLKLRFLLPLAFLSAIVFGVSFVSVREQRETTRIELLKRANSLSGATERLRAQEAVLRRIQAERSPLVPVFKAIHEAAPNGINLQSLGISESGGLQIVGTTRDQQGPTNFAESLAKTGLFERIQLPEVKRGQEREQLAFQLTAQLKNRSARNRGRSIP